MPSESLRVDYVQYPPSYLDPISLLAGDLIDDHKIHQAIDTTLCVHWSDFKNPSRHEYCQGWHQIELIN